MKTAIAAIAAFFAMSAFAEPTVQSNFGGINALDDRLTALENAPPPEVPPRIPTLVVKDGDDTIGTFVQLDEVYLNGNGVRNGSLPHGAGKSWVAVKEGMYFTSGTAAPAPQNPLAISSTQLYVDNCTSPSWMMTDDATQPIYLTAYPFYGHILWAIDGTRYKRGDTSNVQVLSMSNAITKDGTCVNTTAKTLEATPVSEVTLPYASYIFAVE
jgi:hypothetical protein